jgi:hypothetical protein
MSMEAWRERHAGEWVNYRSLHGKVFSSYYTLPNGWTATVTDDSEASAPFRGTRYRVSINCRWWGVQNCGVFLNLESARTAAIELGLKLPACDDAASDGKHC